MLKKSLLILVIVVSNIIGVNAQQNFTVSPDSSITQGNLSNSTLFNYTWIQNNTSDTIWLNWERINMNVPIDWSLSICDEWTCYPPSVTTGSFYVLTNDSSPVVAQYYTNYMVGTGISQISIWEPNDSINNSFTATYVGTILPITNVDNNYDEGLISIYPNPTNHILFVDLKTLTKIKKISVNSIEGKMLKSFDYLGSDFSLDLSAIAPGIYFIQVYTDNRIIRSRFIIK